MYAYLPLLTPIYSWLLVIMNLYFQGVVTCEYGDRNMTFQSHPIKKQVLCCYLYIYAILSICLVVTACMLSFTVCEVHPIKTRVTFILPFNVP